MALDRLVTNSLALYSRVHHCTPKIPPNCARCNEIETDHHLFFRCAYAKAIWFNTHLALRTDSSIFQGKCCSGILHIVLSQVQNHSKTENSFSIFCGSYGKLGNDYHFNRKDKSIHQQCYSGCQSFSYLTNNYDDKYNSQPDEHQFIAANRLHDNNYSLQSQKNIVLDINTVSKTQL